MTLITSSPADPSLVFLLNQNRTLRTRPAQALEKESGSTGLDQLNAVVATHLEYADVELNHFCLEWIFAENVPAQKETLVEGTRKKPPDRKFPGALIEIL